MCYGLFPLLFNFAVHQIPMRDAVVFGVSLFVYYFL